jgi:hypothetical protein
MELITMYDPLVVGGGQPTRDLPPEICRLARREGSVLQAVAECATLEIRIPCSIDLTHPTGPDLGHDFVLGNSLLGLHRHPVDE